METFRPELKVPTTSTDIRKTFAHFRSSWRRKCGTQSCAVTRPTTPDNISLSSSTITLRCPDHTLSVKFSCFLIIFHVRCRSNLSLNFSDKLSQTEKVKKYAFTFTHV